MTYENLKNSRKRKEFQFTGKTCSRRLTIASVKNSLFSVSKRKGLVLMYCAIFFYLRTRSFNSRFHLLTTTRLSLRQTRRGLISNLTSTSLSSLAEVEISNCSRGRRVEAAADVWRMTQTMWMFVRWAAAAVAAVTVQKWVAKIVQLERKLVEAEAALKIARRERSAERTGRIRAQRELKNALVNKKTEDANSTAFPMTPIGTVRSCFSTRNGTPRQPLLVTEARSCVVLYPGGIPVEAFEGLGQYSHCWLLYVFHDNTDLQRLWIKPGHRDFKAKSLATIGESIDQVNRWSQHFLTNLQACQNQRDFIRESLEIHVPRLQGSKMGVFATRSPHRPCPIGLSVAKIEGVYGGMLLLSGADIVDGTPVLDIKPYLPYCDSVDVATAPSWVKAGGSDDVLAVQSVDFSEKFIRELATSWNLMEKYSLYSSPEELQKLLKQVLSRDIRSLNQRERPHTAKLSEVSDIMTRISSDSTHPITGENGLDEANEGTPQTEKFLQLTRDECLESDVLYNLVIEGVNVSYTQDSEGHVVVKGCTVLQHQDTPDVRRCRRGFTS